jgi:hypothetical protein
MSRRTIYENSSGAHPCGAIDRAWEPRIPSPCSLKAITHATGTKIGSSRSSWNRGLEYYHVGTKTHIEYPDIFFWKYNSPYHIELGTYVLGDLLWAGGSVAPAQLTSLRWNWGIFAQTCSTRLEGPYRRDSSGAHPCRATDRAIEPRIPSPCSLKAITHATGSKIGSSRSCWNRGTEYYTVSMKTHIEHPNMFHMSRRTIYERFIWSSSLWGDRQGLRAPNTFPVQFKLMLQEPKSGVLGPAGIGA